jgi:MoaA/NifB/PqqE/SkfB family radical SAM enzyme
MRVPLLRTFQDGVNFKRLNLRRKLYEKVQAPLWTRQPTSVQFDTTNRRCSLSCVYCNPQNTFINETGDLPMSTMEHVLNEMRRNKMFVEWAHPFMNSDPLLDKRMPEITKMIYKNLKCQILTSTNGVLYNRRHLLRDPYLHDVCFTISAATPETYNKVHGKPLFDQAVKTVFWLQKNKFWNQRVYLRYILFGGNIHELDAWRKKFHMFPQEIRPLHFGGDRATSNKLRNALDKNMEQYYDYKQHVYMRDQLPCNCFHNLAIGYDGSFMQCCDLPYKYSWGHVEEIDLQETWQKRLELGLNHPACRECNQKNLKWKELFEKYVWA